MAYKVKLVDKKREGEKVRVYVEYSDGTNVVREDFTVLEKEFFINHVKQKIKELNNLTALETGLAVGDVALPTDPAPTQTELDKQKFFEDLNLWENVKKLVDLGLVDATNAKVVALKNRVLSEFKAEYFSL